MNYVVKIPFHQVTKVDVEIVRDKKGRIANVKHTCRECGRLVSGKEHVG